MKRTLLSLVSLSTLFVAAAASAQEGSQQAGVAAVDPNASAPAEEAPEVVEHAPNHFVMGAVGTGLVATTFADELEINGAFGGGIFGEYTLVPGWLAIELDVRLLAAHEGDEFATELPIDLLLKKPFEISEALEAYIGIGGTFVPVLSPSGADPRGGLACVVGGYYWFAEHLALVAEVDWNLIFGGPNMTQEVGLSAGIALGI